MTWQVSTVLNSHPDFLRGVFLMVCLCMCGSCPGTPVSNNGQKKKKQACLSQLESVRLNGVRVR